MARHCRDKVAVNRMKKDGVTTAFPVFKSKTTVQRNYITIVPSVLRVFHSLKQ